MNQADIEQLQLLPGWQAELVLGYQQRGERTVLASRSQRGPLTVQKSLYPEGDAVCHTILLHPPGGIAGGDELAIHASAEAGAHALLTTPGAAKWYRSQGREAQQRIALNVAAGATLEWLPLETIVFSGARADSDIQLQLSGDARLVWWDIICLGRPAAGEVFTHGYWRQRLQLQRGGELLFAEYTDLAGGDALLDSPVGLAGQPVYGSLLLAGCAIDDALLTELRQRLDKSGLNAGITLLQPDLLLARAIGPQTETVRAALTKVWQGLRHLLSEQSSVTPRIWNT